MGGKRVFSKIDQALCNDQWDDIFANAEVSFLPEGCLDHSPIVIQFYKKVILAKPFKFCNFWANNDMFLDVVEEVWKHTALVSKSSRSLETLKLS